MKMQSITDATEAVLATNDFSGHLKGRGHGERVCLQTNVSRALALAPSIEKGRHFDIVCVGGPTAGPRRVWNADMVRAIADELGVEFNSLVTVNYRR